MMVRRHAPFAITPKARAIWLTCYQSLLSNLDIPDDCIQSFWSYLNIFSAWMVNTEDE
jgi:hemoglobin